MGVIENPICKICGKQCSKFDIHLHLKKYHNISFEDYYVLTELNGVEPRCSCGFCNERPRFNSRNQTFREIATGHDKFVFLEKEYIKKHGNPLCKVCKNQVGFTRGVPLSYCSFKCSGKHAGFSLAKTQQKIKEVVLDKYGVENVSQVPEIAKKAGKAAGKANKGRILPLEVKEKIINSIKERWKDPSYKDRVSKAIQKGTSTKKERLRRKKYAENQMAKDPLYLEKRFKHPSNFLTKFHIKAREKLQLSELGFVSEQKILNYIVDEVNHNSKIIIEFYGDYWHCNPKLYSSNFKIIRNNKVSYSAKEKWEKDKIRIKKLEELGYKVIIIWESDDLEPFKQLLYNFLN